MVPGTEAGRYCNRLCRDKKGAREVATGANARFFGRTEEDQLTHSKKQMALLTVEVLQAKQSCQHHTCGVYVAQPSCGIRGGKTS